MAIPASTLMSNPKQTVYLNDIVISILDAMVEIS